MGADWYNEAYERDAMGIAVGVPRYDIGIPRSPEQLAKIAAIMDNVEQEGRWWRFWRESG